MTTITAIPYATAGFFTLIIVAALFGLGAIWRETSGSSRYFRRASLAYVVILVLLGAYTCWTMFQMASEAFAGRNPASPLMLLMMPVITVLYLIPVAIGMLVIWRVNKRFRARAPQ